MGPLVVSALKLGAVLPRRRLKACQPICLRAMFSEASSSCRVEALCEALEFVEGVRSTYGVGRSCCAIFKMSM